ncbi:MAG: hypothetical protein WCQ72_04395 [Eubacteriales bacterium]
MTAADGRRYTPRRAPKAHYKPGMIFAALLLGIRSFGGRQDAPCGCTAVCIRKITAECIGAASASPLCGDNGVCGIVLSQKICIKTTFGVRLCVTS